MAGKGSTAKTFAELNSEGFALAVVNDEFSDDAFEETENSDEGEEEISAEDGDGDVGDIGDGEESDGNENEDVGGHNWGTNGEEVSEDGVEDDDEEVGVEEGDTDRRRVVHHDYEPGSAVDVNWSSEFSRSEIRAMNQLHVTLPTTPNHMNVSNVECATCNDGLRTAEAAHDVTEPIIHKGMLFDTMNEALAPLRVRSHKPLPWNDLSETHTFHLPCGELAPALQDASMILGLHVDGLPVCAAVEPKGWRDTVEQLLGVGPPDPEQDKKDRKTTGVSSKWLRERFEALLADFNEEAVERSGGTMTRGPSLLLPSCGRGLSMSLEGHVAVEWEPYERDEVRNMNLSPVCTRDQGYWRYIGPLIYFYVVEWHLPSRVLGQFERLQPPKIETVTTSPKLHTINRRTHWGAVNWPEKHPLHLWVWSQHTQLHYQDGPAHSPSAFAEYLRWLHGHSRLILKPPVVADNLGEEDPEDADLDTVDEYDLMTRQGSQPERAPLHNYMAQQLGRIGNEAGRALMHPRGSQEELGTLRDFVGQSREVIGGSQLQDAPQAS
ncbi:hypothetical protein QOZ80_8AG0623020 [Eleusine coracana subsp. coracana]|nr:hypothetical protein QOZ80_8AG0623020 [Eleusine coracana subsp. coracana]